MNAQPTPLNFLDDVIMRHKTGADNLGGGLGGAGVGSKTSADLVFERFQNAVAAFAQGQKAAARNELIALAHANPDDGDLFALLAHFFSHMGRDPYLAKHYHDQATRLHMKKWLSR